MRPPPVRDFLPFLDHLRNARKAIGSDIDPAWNEIPAFYFSNAAAVVGPFDPVAICKMRQWTALSSAVDGDAHRAVQMEDEKQWKRIDGRGQLQTLDLFIGT